MIMITMMALALQAETPNEANSDSTETNASVSAEQSIQKIKIGSKFYAPEEIVCKREAVTGSRLKKRTCKTARYWQFIEQQAQETGDAIQNGINSSRPDGS